MSHISIQVRRFHPLPLLACILILTGCASVVPIGQLLDNSSKYDGKSVKVAGEVHESAGFLGRGAYQLSDGTGTLTVVSENASPPRTGSRIGVKGVFQALFTLGAQSLAVLREQSRFQP